MANKQPPKLGKLSREYHFTLNPYPDVRCSKCPHCDTKTGQRKLPLIIHVDPNQLISINYTNRYCGRCNRLIAHQDEIEHHLTELVTFLNPDMVGNDYLIFGTFEKKAWRESMKKPMLPAETLDHVHDFKSYTVLQMSMGGWFREGQEPPLMVPPPSTEWVKKEG